MLNQGVTRFGFVLALFVLVAVAGPARAGVLYYTFSFSGDGITGSGTLTTAGTPDPDAPLPDAYDILSIAGEVDGEPITGLVGGVGPAQISFDGYFLYDNDFYPAGEASPAGAYFDIDGLLFDTALDDYNLFFEGANYWDWADGGSGVVVSFAAVDPPPPVPEPPSAWLFASMLAALMCAGRVRAGLSRA